MEKFRKLAFKLQKYLYPMAKCGDLHDVNYNVSVFFLPFGKMCRITEFAFKLQHFLSSVKRGATLLPAMWGPPQANIASGPQKARAGPGGIQ